MRRLLPHSIRGRLTLWLGLLLAVILAGFGWTAYRLQQVDLLRRTDDELERRVAALQKDWQKASLAADAARPPPRAAAPLPPPPPPPEDETDDGPPPPERGRPLQPRPGERPRDEPDQLRLSDESRRLFDPTDPIGYYFDVWTRRDQLLSHSGNTPKVPRPARDHPGLVYRRSRGELREIYFFTERGDCLLVGVSVQNNQRENQRSALWLGGCGSAILALGVWGGWLLVGRALRPVRLISDTAVRIAAGDLSERIEVAEDRSELGRLAGVLNSTFARLDEAFAKQKQFTADAAHELRTPLAVLIAEAQACLTRERDPERYRATVAACLEAGQQMRRLTESLLELARFDSNQAPLPETRIDLFDLAREAIAQIRNAADARSVAVSLEGRSARVRGDADQLRRVLLNLLQNAVAYNSSPGAIGVTLSLTSALVVLTVADTGQGISPEDLPHIFERFFRVDKVRSGGEHAGLGLSICQAIVHAHGGTITAESRLGQGSKFIVTFTIS